MSKAFSTISALLDTQEEESKKGFTGIPDQFFSDLLPAIADINELKLVIYILWSVYKQGDFGVALHQLDGFDHDAVPAL